MCLFNEKKIKDDKNFNLYERFFMSIKTLQLKMYKLFKIIGFFSLSFEVSGFFKVPEIVETL